MTGGKFNVIGQYIDMSFSNKITLFLIKIVPETNLPAGRTTVPPAFLVQTSIAAWMAFVFNTDFRER